MKLFKIEVIRKMGLPFGQVKEIEWTRVDVSQSGGSRNVLRILKGEVMSLLDVQHVKRFIRPFSE